MRRLYAILILCALLLAGCSGTAAGRDTPPVPVATLMPTPTGPPPPTDAPPAPSEVPADSGWIAAAPGAELRRMRVSLGAGVTAQVQIVRLDPGQIRFTVGYAPDAPRSLAAWFRESGALALINGGFFDEQNRTVSLLARDGELFGESYSGRGGMFAVTPDGQISLRGLSDAPYDPSEPLATAIQGWPLLVRPGGAAAYDFEDGERARRSALAIDRAGRVLLIASPGSSFTLAELAAWLAGSDLQIDAAINLDGGSSTGLLLDGPTARERVEAFVPLPIVLIALPR